jgi:hypothetical protein
MPETIEDLQRRQRLIAVGEALYGERWIRPLAELVGYSHVLVRHVSAGKRRPTDEFTWRVDQAATLRRAELEAEMRRIDEIAETLHLEIARDAEPDSGPPRFEG